MNFRGLQHCNARRTYPQPDGEHLTFIALLDYEDTNSPVVLADIDLTGGIPRRHTAQLDRNEETGRIIRRLDRDRRCFPPGTALCAIRHATRVFFDFDNYSPSVFDYVSVFEVINPLDDDDMDSISLWQKSSLQDAGPLMPIFAPLTARLDQEIDDFCDLDEYIYPYPYVTDENDMLDLPAQHLWLSQSHDLTLLRAMNVEHPAQVRLDTYGLHNEYVGNRVGHIAHVELANMLRVVSQLWAEYSLGSHMYVFRADPQPEGTPPNTMVLIVEFPVADRDHTFYRATLVDTKLDGRATDRLTAYVPREATVANVADAVNHDGSCWPQGLEECHVMVKMMQYSHQDRFEIRSGDYFIFTVYTFQSRFGLLGNVFQGAHQYARDFLWRSRHFGRQEFTILVHAATQHYERTEPRPLRRTIDDFRHAEELWQDAIQAWATHGANENSQLQAVWPQTIYQSGQENVHIILTIGPIFPWLPILLSVIAHFGHDSPRRIETQAWQVPRQPTVQHLMALTCFWRFSQEQAGDPYIVYARQQYHGADTVIDIQRGGHYELHLQLPTISTFVLNLAQYFHRLDLEPAADTSEDDERTPPPDGGRDDETALIQGSTIPADSESEGISLIQKTLTLSTVVVLAHSGYTDIFLDRVWPLTTEGEQQMSPNIDPVDLRNRWQRVSDLHGIPRPVDVALIIICRPYHLGARTQELHITLARFDDPTVIPQEITDHWSDLSETAWRLYPSHHATREARTVDVDGWRFMLLTERQSRGHSFSTGSIEIVSRFQEDEHSFMFTATMPARTSWGHIWSWLRLGDQFFGDHLLQVYLNDVTILAPFASMQLEHGYFLQVIAHSRTQEGYAVIPFARIQGWCRDFRIAAPSTYGNVYRAGYTLDESGHARLPYHKRDQEIVTSWPDLTVWTKYRVHDMAKGRNPPWFPFDNAQIVHPLPNGVQVAIICSVYEGTGASTYALIFNRIISVQAILSSLKCVSRCNSEEYICRTEHNGLQVTLDATITLDEGDFVEVFISSTHFNLDAQSIHVADTAPRSEPETTATPTTTSYPISPAHDNGAEGCRYDCVHRPFVDDPTVLGGSSTKYLSLALYTRSFVIFRLAIGLVGHHPPRDVETPLGNNTTPDLIQEDNATFVKAMDPCKDRMSRQHSTQSISTTHDLISTSPLRLIQLVQAARSDDWNDSFAYLPPPGNGPPEIFNLDSDDESMADHPDQRVNISIETALKEPRLQIVDLRDRILLDTMDDWYIGSQQIFISQIHPQKTAISFKIPFSVNDSSNLLDDWRPGIFQTSFADIPDLHHIGAAFIDAAWPFDLDDLVSIDIFVDGSVASNLDEGPVAGFAIVVVGNLNGSYNTGYCMIGYTCGTVCTDPQEQAWMGSDFPSSIEAERCGVCIGLLWALQNPRDTGIPIHLHFDCTSAGFAADGSWKLSAHSLSSLMTRAIGQCAQEVLGPNITNSPISQHMREFRAMKLQTPLRRRQPSNCCRATPTNWTSEG